jgi:uncharacterized membrane protein
LLAALLATAGYFIIARYNSYNRVQNMLTLDVFNLAMLIMSWITFFTTPYHELRQQAKEQDGSRIFIFIILLISALGSMLSVGLLLVNKSKHDIQGFELGIAVAGMIFSWLLVHTVFTYRYAHVYYADDGTEVQTDIKGLEFPDDDKPDFLDFAYFSFVMGMTFQVSDVVITEKRLRRLALLHGLISFFYNTIIIALTINILAGGDFSPNPAIPNK